MDKRTQILAATEQLIATRGLDKVSMQQVATQAQVAAGTIYRYFNDKEDLLRQLSVHLMMQCATHIQQGVKDEPTLKDQFERLWRNTWTMMLQRDHLLLSRDQFDALPRDDQSQTQQEREAFSDLYQVFQSGKQQRRFKPLEDEILITLGLEPAFCLARKQVRGVITLDNYAIADAIHACWDAISLH
ncbi:TetR/AcrR family transcriptional regulator [Salinivibrio socompensis]|uniref:TetR/AcrR family transcriptional regulator n=1 Tax=Salinivibrio socompensis TaxID=1510206 RepID=UPI00046E951A|nr:TetR/AcrR family transcriptional regulator [Salinivibrio socompensis]